MSARIRGQEALIQITVDDEPRAGSFFKVKDFRSTPRTDLTEEPYLGEQTDDLDTQHHGFDITFSVDNQDAETLRLLDLIVANEEAHIAPPDVVIAVTYLYREPGQLNQTEQYSDGVIKVAEQGIGGRKEYITTGFEAKFKTRQRAIALT